MTSRTLSLTITCPDWCQESPIQHLERGAIYHKHTIGKVEATTGAVTAAGDDVVGQVEVTIERFDDLSADGLTDGPLLVRLGGDELYPAEAVRDLAALLLRTVDVLDSGSVSTDVDTTAQVLTEQDAVAQQLAEGQV